MTELVFDALDARAEPYAATPNLLFRLRVAEVTGEVVHAIALRCQLRIEPQRRRYDPGEQEQLVELFGETPRWGDTLKPFLWTHTVATVPGFTGSVEFELPVTCSYDFDVAAAKYLHALRDGEIPLILLFSGTIFCRGATGFSVEQVPWHKEATYRLPVRVWRELMDLYFPSGGWIRLHVDTIDALQKFKVGRALPTWDEAFTTLLAEAGVA